MNRFYYSDDFLLYNMGPNHPMRPERLRRTFDLLCAYGLPGTQLEIQAPVLADVDEVSQMHSREFVEALLALDRGERLKSGYRYGLGTGDNPIFDGIGAAALRYSGASIQAAQDVIDAHRQGVTTTAFNIAGGLHHAHYNSAAGFCVLNDCALAANRLRKHFDRVAYIDIDVHHGDGVQELFYTDPSVLTVSLHEYAPYFFPGTGFLSEIGDGDGAGTSLNVPLAPGTTDSIWIKAWRDTALPIIRAYKPEAIVLQMGTDAHHLDPLANLELTAQGWLTAVKDVADLGLPTVAVGGGGYNLSTVSRMWVAAVGTLAGVALADRVPETCRLAKEMPFLLDQTPHRVNPTAVREAEEYAEAVEQQIKDRFSAFYSL
jgi:acetoin utilization protein AcuC